MPPLLYSRHVLVPAVTRVTDGLTFLLDREPLRFRERSDNRRVIVDAGDSWQSLAATFFAPIKNAAQLWWVILDFQPAPVTDASVPPSTGSTVYIPTPEFVMAEVFSRERKGEADI